MMLFGFCLGFVLGTLFGILSAAFLAAGSDDDYMEDDR